MSAIVSFSTSHISRAYKAPNVERAAVFCGSPADCIDHATLAENLIRRARDFEARAEVEPDPGLRWWYEHKAKERRAWAADERGELS